MPGVGRWASEWNPLKDNAKVKTQMELEWAHFYDGSVQYGFAQYRFTEGTAANPSRKDVFSELGTGHFFSEGKSV